MAGEDDILWSLIEAAWQRLGPAALAGREALTRRAPEPGSDEFARWLDGMVENLRDDCAALSDAELLALDQTMDLRLDELDRPDIYEVVEGSDDGFLYRRAFIVARGREFHAAVLADPETAVDEAECEDFLYVFSEARANRG
jgi:hypothetical protein